jgi:hypothetical protein
MKVVCAGGRVRPVDLESMGAGPVAALCCWAGRPGAPKVRPEALVEKVVTATPLEEPRSRPYGSRHFLKSLVLTLGPHGCALCDDNGAAVVHEGHLIGCSYFQEFRDGANNRGNAHTRRLVWDAYAENTSGRRL